MHDQGKQEPNEPRCDVKPHFLCRLDHVVVSVPFLPNFRQHAIELLRTELGSCHAHVCNRVPNTPISIIEREDGYKL